MPAMFMQVATVEQFDFENGEWLELITLDPKPGKVEDRYSKTCSLLQEILSLDHFYLTRQSDGFAVIGNKADGPIRIKWKSKLDKAAKQ